MAEKWDKQLMDFLKRTGDELKRSGEELKDEAQRLLVEVKDPAKQAKVKEGLENLRTWAVATGKQAAERLEGAARRVEESIEGAVGGLNKDAPTPSEPATPPTSAAPATETPKAEPLPAKKAAAKAGSQKSIGRKKPAAKAPAAKTPAAKTPAKKAAAKTGTKKSIGRKKGPPPPPRRWVQPARPPDGLPSALETSRGEHRGGRSLRAAPKRLDRPAPHDIVRAWPARTVTRRAASRQRSRRTSSTRR
jgi:hypothetical protein